MIWRHCMSSLMQCFNSSFGITNWFVHIYKLFVTALYIKVYHRSCFPTCSYDPKKRLQAWHFQHFNIEIKFERNLYFSFSTTIKKVLELVWRIYWYRVIEKCLLTQSANHFSKIPDQSITSVTDILLYSLLLSNANFFISQPIPMLLPFVWIVLLRRFKRMVTM